MMATFVVSDVSHHARMRAKERGLPLESLSGGACAWCQDRARVQRKPQDRRRNGA